MSGPGIVVVTYNWPPQNAIGTHRPYAWARYWAEAGARVTVLTARKQPFDAPFDLDLPTSDGVTVIEVPYQNPGGVLSRRVIRSEGARRALKKLRAVVSGKTSAVGDPRAAWLDAARTEAMRLASETDIVVSTYGPASTHLLASEMKAARPDLRWVADYRDLWSQRHDQPWTDRQRAAQRDLECASVGARADFVTAVSADMIRQLTNLTGKPGGVVPNGFDIDESAVKARLDSPRTGPGRPFRLVHAGRIYDGLRDPTPLLTALAALRADGIIRTGDVTVDFYGAHVHGITALARDPTFAPFIRLMGHVPRETALKAQQDADLLLLLESPLPEARGVLTGKLFEYISAGRPILCVGSRPEYEIGRVLADTGTGVVFGPDQYDGIKPALAETMTGAGLFRVFQPRLSEIMRFSRKRQALAMLETLRAL